MPSPELDAREYKLLLKPQAFAAARGETLLAELWHSRLEPMMIATWDRNHYGTAKTRGELRLTEERRVQFYDTASGLLALNAYSLRRRQPLAQKPGKTVPGEWTLKLRTPDLFIAAAAKLTGTSSSAKSKLEEDIAPLPPERAPRGSSRTKPAPSPHLIRSRFSKSTRQSGGPLKSVGQLFEFYPTLAANLDAAAARAPRLTERLLGGAEIAERVYEGAEVNLGSGVDAAFALSLWNIGANGALPKAAEISFKCKLDDGVMSAAAALRAYQLFAALQRELAPIVETRALSKTALVIPKRIGAP